MCATLPTVQSSTSVTRSCGILHVDADGAWDSTALATIAMIAGRAGLGIVALHQRRSLVEIGPPSMSIAATCALDEVTVVSVIVTTTLCSADHLF